MIYDLCRAGWLSTVSICVTRIVRCCLLLWAGGHMFCVWRLLFRTESAPKCWQRNEVNRRQTVASAGGTERRGGGGEETVWGLWEGGVIGSAGSKCFYCCCCSKLNWGAHVFACLYSNSYSYSYSLFVIRIRYSLEHSLLFVRIHSSCKIVGGSTKRRTKRSPKDINKWAKAAREAK